MTTLFSSLLHLHTLHDAVIPEAHGHQSHAAFLALMQQADPQVAAWLHDENRRKPFTVSPLRSFRPAHSEQLRVRAGEEGWLRLTLAGDDYFRLFLGRFAEWGGAARLTIGRADFTVSAILTTPGSHPWAGYLTPQDLLEKASSESEIRLELATPTAFSMGDGEVELMPRPDLVFGGLARKWKEWCNVPLPGPLPDRTWLLEHVRTADMQLDRVRWRYEHRLQLGAVGQIAYRVFKADPVTLCTLNVLADFAFFAGLGQKTTQGMGQARRLKQ